MHSSNLFDCDRWLRQVRFEYSPTPIAASQNHVLRYVRSRVQPRADRGYAPLDTTALRLPGLVGSVTSRHTYRQRGSPQALLRHEIPVLDSASRVTDRRLG